MRLLCLFLGGGGNLFQDLVDLLQEIQLERFQAEEPLQEFDFEISQARFQAMDLLEGLRHQDFGGDTFMIDGWIQDSLADGGGRIEIATQRVPE